MTWNENDPQFSLRHQTGLAPSWIAEHRPSGCMGAGSSPMAALADLAAAMAHLGSALSGRQLNMQMSGIQRALTAPTARSFVATMADEARA